MEDVVSRSVNQPRLLSSLTSLFGGLAGVLAAVGVYGVMAYTVRRQRREFGIRMALGADPRRVRRARASGVVSCSARWGLASAPARRCSADAHDASAAGRCEAR